MNILKKSCLTAVIFFILIVNCFAFMSTADIGTSSGSFLKFGAGARAAGMGNAFTAIADDPTGIYWNPAGLNGTKDIQVSLMHALWFGDASYEWAGGVINLGNKYGVVGLGFQYFGYGAVTQTAASGAVGSAFSPNDMAIIGSYANRLMGFDLGLNVKYVALTLTQSASTFTFDLGVAKTLSFDRKPLKVALFCQNILGNVKFSQESMSLPMVIKAGGAYWLDKNFVVSLDAVLPSDNIYSAAVGTEYGTFLSEEITGFLRGGYSFQPSGINGLSLGFGVRYKDYQLDYAFSPYGDLGATHKISVNIIAMKGAVEEENDGKLVFRKFAPSTYERKTFAIKPKPALPPALPVLKRTAAPVTAEVKPGPKKKTIKRIIRRKKIVNPDDVVTSEQKITPTVEKQLITPEVKPEQKIQTTEDGGQSTVEKQVVTPEQSTPAVPAENIDITTNSEPVSPPIPKKKLKK